MAADLRIAGAQHRCQGAHQLHLMRRPRHRRRMDLNALDERARSLQRLDRGRAFTVGELSAES